MANKPMTEDEREKLNDCLESFEAWVMALVKNATSEDVAEAVALSNARGDLISTFEKAFIK